MAFLKLTDVTQVHDPRLYLTEVGGWDSTRRAEERGWWIKKKKNVEGGRGVLSANQRRNQIKRTKSKKNTTLLFWGHKMLAWRLH